MKPVSLLVLLLAFAALLVPGPGARAERASSSSTAPSPMPPSDRHFLEDAAVADTAEIVYGTLAAQKAFSPLVREFGQTMVNQHARGLDALRQLAARRGVTLQLRLTSDQISQRNRLTRLGGVFFDRAYVVAMARDHKERVAMYERETNFGGDPEVMSLAARTLPTLRQHLIRAQELAGQRPRDSAK